MNTRIISILTVEFVGPGHEHKSYMPSFGNVAYIVALMKYCLNTSEVFYEFGEPGKAMDEPILVTAITENKSGQEVADIVSNVANVYEEAVGLKVLTLDVCDCTDEAYEGLLNADIETRNVNNDVTRKITELIDTCADATVEFMQEQEQRDNERIEAARLKRERKAAKRKTK